MDRTFRRNKLGCPGTPPNGDTQKGAKHAKNRPGGVFFAHVGGRTAAGEFGEYADPSGQ